MKASRVLSTGLLALVMTSVALPAPVFAGGHSAFNPDELECTIYSYYGFFPQPGQSAASAPGAPAAPDVGIPSTAGQSCTGYASDLTDIDRNELSDAIADEVKILSPSPFNDVVVHLAADYRQQPEHREAIEQLVSSIHNKVVEELRAQDEQHPALTILDDVFMTFTVAYTFGFGKGLWESRGSGLEGIARFRNAIKSAYEGMAEVRRYRLALIGIGTAIGAAHAIFQYLETKKLDPNSVLDTTQSGVVQDLATTAASRRDEMRRDAALSPDQLRPQMQALRDRIRQVEPELTNLQNQMAHLYDAAPRYRSRMQPAADDIQAARLAISQLGSKLDDLQVGANRPN
jgi:hypothetical protein